MEVGFIMAKYTFEFKKKVVFEYLHGGMGSTSLAKKYNIKTVVSMNPIMIDGTGMCGCCRLTVGGKVKFACVDGPEFDGHEIDFDEAISRSKSYTEFEAHARDAACNLFKKEVK